MSSSCSNNPGKCKRDPSQKTVQIVKHFQANILTDSSRTSTADTTTTTDPCSTIKSTMCESQEDEEDLYDDDCLMCTTNYEDSACSKSRSKCSTHKRARLEMVTVLNADLHVPKCGTKSPCQKQQTVTKNEGCPASRWQIKLSNISSTHPIQPHIKNLSCKNLCSLGQIRSEKAVSVKSSSQKELCNKDGIYILFYVF